MTNDNIDNIVKLAAFQELARNDESVTEDAAALAFRRPLSR